MFTTSWAKYQEYSLEKDGALDAMKGVKRALDFWVRNRNRQPPIGDSIDALKTQGGMTQRRLYQ